MKMTLLEIVQDILSDLDSDEVNSINDTMEAQQVMRIVRTTYDEIIGSRKWPHLSKISQLEGQSDTTKPTHLKIPENVQYIEWFKYNQRDRVGEREKMVALRYRTPEQFLAILHQRDSTSSTVQTVYDDDVSVGPLLINIDAHPTYWTSFDDEYIVLDSLDNSIVGQQTATSERTLVQVYEETVFVNSDTFVPNLPAKAFPYLLSESKSVAFNTLSQEPNAKEEQRSRRQRTYLSRDKRRSNKGIRYPDYGRKGPRMSHSADSQTDNISVNDPDYLP